MDLKQTESDTFRILLDGKEITPEQLQESIESAKLKKGVAIVEVSPNKFRTRIQG